jgi:hypothetical protein
MDVAATTEPANAQQAPNEFWISSASRAFSQFSLNVTL